MADYPGAIPTIADDKTNATVTQNDHPAHHNTLADELVAGLTTLGVNPQGSEATVVARLDALGEWDTWTPTLGNIAIGTGGNAGLEARFCRVGSLVTCTVVLRLGTSGASVSGTPTLTLPLTARALPFGTTRMAIGTAVLPDSGVQAYQGHFNLTGTNEVSVLYSALTAASVGAPIINGAITSTTPFTWGQDDFISGLFAYETTA